jgi:hypothetical protein
METTDEFRQGGLARRVEDYRAAYLARYDKLAVLDQITSGMSGVSGLFAKTLVGYLVALGKKGLDTSSA